MKQFVRVINIILIIALLFALLMSCGEKNSDGAENESTTTPDNDKGVTEVQEEVEEVNVNTILAGLPANDYEGYEFKIWTSNWFNSTLEGRQAPEAEQTGEPINDALYLRDRLVEEKYNIKIVYTIVDDASQLLSQATKSVKAGDNAFDYVMDNMITVTKGLAQIGAVYDFNEVPNVDLSNEWWSKYAIRDLTIDGKFFFPTGDITARYPGSQYVLLFNKNCLPIWRLNILISQYLTAHGLSKRSKI